MAKMPRVNINEIKVDMGHHSHIVGTGAILFSGDIAGKRT